MSMFVVLMGVFSFLFASNPDLQAQSHRRPVPVGLLRRRHQERPDVAARERVSADQGARPVLDSGGHVDLERRDHARRVLGRHRDLSGRRRPSADAAALAAFAAYCAALIAIVDRLLAGVERAVPAVPRSESGVGSRASGRVFSRADHLPARDSPRAVSFLSVLLAADAGHRVLARRARARRHADARPGHLYLAADAVVCLLVGHPRSSVGSARARRSTCRDWPCRSSKSTACRRRSGSRACSARPCASTCWACCEPRRFQRLQVLDGVSFDVAARRGARHHGPQRLGQEHAAEDRVRRLPAGPGARRAPAPSITPILELGVGWNPELDAVDNVLSRSAR